MIGIRKLKLFRNLEINVPSGNMEEKHNEKIDKAISQAKAAVIECNTAIKTLLELQEQSNIDNLGENALNLFGENGAFDAIITFAQACDTTIGFIHDRVTLYISIFGFKVGRTMHIYDAMELCGHHEHIRSKHWRELENVKARIFILDGKIKKIQPIE